MRGPADHDPKPEDIGIEDMESNSFLNRGTTDPTAVCLTTVGLEEIDFRGEKALHRIVTAEFRIGRHPECNMVLQDDAKVSRRHARIYRLGEECLIEDNGSSNGTFVNGEKVEEPRMLKPGDKVGIGAREFTFVKCMDSNLPPGL
jgi:pSer/pThr/pTyr-binding forkhead associated (FHA) protein